MKKFLFALLMLLAGTNYGRAQQKLRLNQIGWQANTTLYNFLTGKLHDQYVHRDSVLSEALDHNSLNTYQQNCRERYIQLLGKLPQKTPLNAQITGTIQQDGYHIEKVVYQSFPNHHVTANLYVPDGKGKFPGVLFFCGHESTAKATLTYQQTAILFAKHGFIVLSIDPISQAERYQLTDAEGQPTTHGGTTGHTLLASNSNLVGTSVVAYQLWDNECGLDYLCSLKNVDTTRLGCLGNSGGGTQTAYFIPYDARIKVASICSYTTRRERTLELLGPQDGCQWLPGESKAGLDISDYAIMFAPKPLLILAGRYGFVDFNGVKDVYRELKDVYTKMHQGDKVKLFAYDDGHGIQIPKQEAAVQWFRRWLYNDNAPVKEGYLPTLSEKELNVTKTGQVNATYKGEENIQDRNLRLADSWKQHREDLWKQLSQKEYRAMLRSVTNIQNTHSPVDVENNGSFEKDGYLIEKLLLRKAGAPPMPCFLASPKDVRNQRLIIYLSDKGKNEIINNDSLLKRHYRKGDALLLADLRGMGETADAAAFNNTKYFNKEYRNAMLAMFTAEALPVQRAEDIFTLLDYSKTNASLKKLFIDVNASGIAAEPALIAASLDSRINKVQCIDSVKSFYDLLHHPTMKDQYSYVIAGVLQYFDLPDLEAFINKHK
ncbi:acetylxylan esterase [Arachidicoccus sp.]|uniref:acetylxylan esterase n=1 Tax=Arachidicoccus sp. TaxID=1872624 RepID=UPI003D253298